MSISVPYLVRAFNYYSLRMGVDGLTLVDGNTIGVFNIDISYC